jgi:hypothetical protein
MQRRVALAIALALTIVTAFSIIVVGTRTGLFGNDHSAAAVAEFTAATVPAAPSATPSPPQVAAQAPDPIVVTEYVYLDEPAPAAARPQNGAAPSAASASGQAADDSGEQEDVDEVPTRAPQPTQPAAHPTAPLSQPTPPPAQPTSPPPPTQPPAPPAPTGPSELEFTGAVTAINGEIVTWSHDDTTTAVRVTENLDRLQVGTRAKVHAIRTASGYVAKEIEFSEGGD